jgi:hypothetical protein
MSVVQGRGKKLRVDTAFGGILTAAGVWTGLVDFLAVSEVLLLRGIFRDMPLPSHHFLEVVMGRWFHWGFVHCTTLFCLCTHLQDGLQFIQCYHIHAVISAKSSFPSRDLQKFTVLLRAFHNRGPLIAFPHFSRCASGKDPNVTEYCMYLLHYRNCFWVSVRDSMKLRFQRCKLLCPVFPESWYWDVRHRNSVGQVV